MKNRRWVLYQSSRYHIQHQPPPGLWHHLNQRPCLENSKFPRSLAENKYRSHKLFPTIATLVPSRLSCLAKKWQRSLALHFLDRRATQDVVEAVVVGVPITEAAEDEMHQAATHHRVWTMLQSHQAQIPLVIPAISVVDAEAAGDTDLTPIGIAMSQHLSTPDHTHISASSYEGLWAFSYNGQLSFLRATSPISNYTCN